MTRNTETEETRSLAQMLTMPPELPLRRIHAGPEPGTQTVMEHRIAQAWAQISASGSELPAVSVILPTRDRAYCVQSAISSVLEQSYPRIEILVIDDGSRDGTSALSILRDSRIRLIRLKGEGVAAARNAGLVAATGDIVAYIDSDNRWQKDHLRNLVTALEVSGAACAFDMLVLRGDDGKPARYRGEPFDWAECLHANYVDMNVLVHRWNDDIARLRFDPALRRGVDWDFVLRLTQGRQVAFVPLPGCDCLDSKADRSRITVSEPRMFLNMVREKARSGLPIAGVLLRRRFRIFVPPHAQGLADAFLDMGHRVVALTQDRLLPASVEVALLWQQGDIAVVPLDVVTVLVLEQEPATLHYAQLDRFDVIMTRCPDLALHLTAVLRRSVIDISLCTDRALAETIIAALQRGIVQPRRGHVSFPPPFLAKAARRQIGLISQRGRRWPNASSYLRVLCPLTTPSVARQFQVIELAGTDDPRLSDCDAVIVQRFALQTAADARKLGDFLKATGRRLVVDSDDHPGVLGSNDPRTEALLQAMHIADQVHVASQNLADLHAPQRAVLKVNRLDPRVWRGGLAPPHPPSRQQPLRIVYTGTPTHDADFAPVAHALDQLWRRHPGAFNLTVLGALSQPVNAPWINPVGQELRQTAYPDFCQRLLAFGPFHLGLAPLDRNTRNDAKSDLRCLDNAALGAATLAADVPAYANLIAAGLAFGTSQDEDGWLSSLTNLLENAEIIHQRAIMMCDYLWTKRVVSGNLGLGEALEQLFDESPV